MDGTTATGQTPEEMARASPAGLAKFATRGGWTCYSFLALLNRWLVEAAFMGGLWLLVNMPPRHGKSTLVSKFFPPWYTGIFPDRRVLLASYESNFAASWGLASKDVAEAWGERIFGVRVRRDVSAASNWRYRGHDGGMATAGVEGAFTGKGGHVLIVDDPIKNAEEARSAARRELIWTWFNTVALTRLDEPRKAVVVVVQTRWNQDDLAGRIKREHSGERIIELNFPAIAESEDELGRAVGDPLCPQRFDRASLDSIKARLGSYWWSALYQQRPRPEEGNVFKESWFSRYVGEPRGIRFRRSIILDSAHKEKKTNDYSAMAVFDLMDSGIYLRHVWRDKVVYPDLKKKAVDMHQSWGADELCIEDKDVGAALIQELRKDTSLPVIEIQAEKDKVARASAASPMCEAGRVFLPADGEAAWVESFMEELLSFPNAEHDDMVDVFVHGINRLKGAGAFLPDLKSVLVDTGNVSIGSQLEPPL